MPRCANASFRHAASFFGFVLVAFALPAHAEVRLTEQLQHYILDADRIPAFREQLKHHLAQKPPGTASRTHGLTDSDIEVRYELLPGDARCEMTNLAVLLTVELTLPRWVPRDEPSPDMRKQAQAILDGLVVHGMDHRQHTLQAARTLDESLQALPPETDCKQLQRQAQRTVRRQLNRLRVEEGQYDLTSDLRHRPIPPPANALTDANAPPTQRMARSRGWRRTMPATLTRVGQ